MDKDDRIAKVLELAKTLEQPVERGDIESFTNKELNELIANMEGELSHAQSPNDGPVTAKEAGGGEAPSPSPPVAAGLPRAQAAEGSPSAPAAPPEKPTAPTNGDMPPPPAPVRTRTTVNGVKVRGQQPLPPPPPDPPLVHGWQVAPGRSLTTLGRGVLGPGEAIFPSDVQGGEAQLEKLSPKYVLKGPPRA